MGRDERFPLNLYLRRASLCPESDAENVRPGLTNLNPSHRGKRVNAAKIKEEDGMDLQELEKLIKERRSIRRWKKQDVSDELLKKAIELATWAPNGGNFQGWRFVVVKNRQTIETMANAVQAVAEKIATWPESAAWPEEMERARKNASYFRNAPVCIATFVGRYQSAIDKALEVRGPSDPEAGQIRAFRRTSPTAIQSIAAAVTTMLLVFQNMGLGAVWLGAPLMAMKEINTILKAPAGLDLTGLIAVGYPDESPRRDRKPVEQVMEFIR
jgi:nitroreductase